VINAPRVLVEILERKITVGSWENDIEIHREK
jgi:hypothetical protein